MRFKKQRTDNYLLGDTPLENIFISEYAKNAPGDYVKVYLLALMYSNIERDADDAQLAAALSMDKAKVGEAWDYWQEQGLIERRQKSGGNGETEIEFVSIKEKIFGKPGAVPARSEGAKKLGDKELAGLFRDIEQSTGRLLESGEPETVAGWIGDFGIKPEAVLAAYSYCVKNSRSTRYRYVEKVLMAWRDKGLDTKEKIQEYLEDTDRRYDFHKKVFKALGFRRNPTDAERDMMDSWTDDLGCSLADVLEACKKTTGINNPNLNYINSILVNGRAKEASENAETNAALLKAVEERYERIRNDNARKASVIREKIYTDVPRLREISEESMSLGIRISRSILKGASGKAELTEAREKQNRLNEEKKKLLADNGYKEDALDTVYTCKRCHDTGTLEDGTRCSCFYDRLREVKNEQ